MAVDPKPLEYDRSSQPFATRRQFRVLVLLMVVQIALSIQSIYAPGMLGMIRQWLADRRAATARDAEIRQLAALEKQCLQFAQPSTKVVWEEDPGEAAKLLKLDGYWPRPCTIITNNNVAMTLTQSRMQEAICNGIPPYAFARVPEAMGGLFSSPSQLLSSRPSDPEGGLIYLHACSTARGEQRLVVVTISGDFGPLSPSRQHSVEDAFTDTITKSQTFRADLYIPANGQKQLDKLAATTLSLHPDSDRLEMPLHWMPSPSPEKPGRVNIDDRDVLRVYAGQPDPAEASHFTIAYTLDGKPGVIDGRLLDSDRVELKPRIGTVVGDRWYPRADDPSTRPAAGQQRSDE